MNLRYALRSLARRPGVTAVAVLSLALGIGANTTIFTLVNTIFLRPLPVEKPDELMMVFTTEQRGAGTQIGSLAPMSIPNYRDYRDQNDVFSGLAALQFTGVNWAGTAEPERITGQIVTGNYFDVLGVKAAIGRTFLPDEDRTPGTHPVVVLSHSFWMRRMGGDRAAVGRTMTLNGSAYHVIGVMPAGFTGTFAFTPDLWLPMMMYKQVLSGPLLEWFEERRPLIFFVFGRLRPGVTPAQAEAALKTIAARLEKEYPTPNEGRSAAVLPLAQANLPPAQRATFVQAGALLMAVVGLVLLVACVNVANLLLARANERRKEIAIRLSIGASRARLVRQLLTESLLLAVVGGAAGLLLAFWARDLVWSLRPSFLPAAALSLDLDGRVLGFTGALAVLTGILFGLLPAMQSTRADVVNDLKDLGAAPVPGRFRIPLRHALVVGQVTLSLVALISSGLFLRSLGNAQKINPGFDSARLGALAYDLAAQGYSQERGVDFHRRVVERARAMPGVVSAAVATNRPLSGGGFMRSVFPEGEEVAPGKRGVFAIVDAIGPGYFTTLGIPLLAGRDFTDADREGSAKVVIVNEAFARRFWPDRDPLGRRFKFFGDEQFTEVVGVARNSKYNFIGEDPQLYAYYPLAQNYSAAMNLFVRAERDPGAALAAVRHEVQSMDRTLPLLLVETMAQTLDNSLWAPRLGAALLGALGALALALAAVGMYGVMSYAVGRRTREIGIRMALGARRGDVLRMVFRQGMTLTLAGVALGVAAALVVSRFVTGLLYDVSPTDPVTFASVVGVLAAVAAVACLIPARRATRVDPLTALRWE